MVASVYYEGLGYILDDLLRIGEAKVRDRYCSFEKGGSVIGVC